MVGIVGVAVSGLAGSAGQGEGQHPAQRAAARGAELRVEGAGVARGAAVEVVFLLQLSITAVARPCYK